MNSLKNKNSSFKILNNTIEKLFQNFVNNSIVIPLYQRRYTWDEEQIIPLLEDILDRTKDSSEHYFGVIARTINNKILDDKDIIQNRIIDGQQRITTSIILIHRVRTLIEEQIEGFPKIKGFSSLFKNIKYEYEIETNILEEIGLILEYKIDNFKTHSIKNAIEIINDFIRKKQIGGINELELFLNTFLKKFKICLLEYEIKRDQEMLVFENLNSKGSPLSEFDLIKNLIISFEAKKPAKEYLVHFNDKLFTLTQGGSYKTTLKKGENLFEKFIEHFLVFKTSKPLEIKKTYKIYKNLKDFINKNNYTFKSLCNELRKFFILYLEICNPIEICNPKYIGQNIWIRSLSKKDVHIPLIFFLFDQFSSFDEESDDSSWKINNIIKEYLKVVSKHLIKLMTVSGTGQSFGSLIRFIIKKIQENKNSTEIQKILKENPATPFGRTPSNEQFIQNCLTKPKNNWLSESIVDIIQENILLKNGEKIDYINTRTLEHIMPKTPGNKWPFISSNDQNFEEHLNMIGNLLFLDKNKNTGLGNNSFEYKKENYLWTTINPLVTLKGIDLKKYKLKSINKIPKWTYEEIKNRSKILAKLFCDI